MHLHECEPTNHNQALQAENQQEAMKEEINAIEKNHTWVLVDHSNKESRRCNAGL